MGQSPSQKQRINYIKGVVGETGGRADVVIALRTAPCHTGAGIYCEWAHHNKLSQVVPFGLAEHWEVPQIMLQNQTLLLQRKKKKDALRKENTRYRKLFSTCSVTEAPSPMVLKLPPSLNPLYWVRDPLVDDSREAFPWVTQQGLHKL